jgi:VanZ family protein
MQDREGKVGKANRANNTGKAGRAGKVSRAGKVNNTESKPENKLRPILLWGAAALWMVVIFMFSSDNAINSEAKSSAVFSLLSELLSDDAILPGEPLDMVFFIRKAAHFIEYFILSALVSAAWAATALRKGRRGRDARGRAMLFGMAFGAVYAATDELHQYFVPGRAARAADVLLDAAGAAAGAGFVWLAFRVRRAIYDAKRIGAKTNAPKAG